MSFYLDPAYGRMTWQYQPVPFDGSAAKAFANLLATARKEPPAYTRVNPFASSIPVLTYPVYTVTGGINAAI